MNEKQCECRIETCDIFDCMARQVGMTVIHPGGFDATRQLAESCHLSPQSRVIDIACAKGTSAVYLAERYGCDVVGLDISDDLITQANALAKRKGLARKVTFRVGDALQLPFPDNDSPFDAIKKGRVCRREVVECHVLRPGKNTKNGRLKGWGPRTKNLWNPP